MKKLFVVMIAVILLTFSAVNAQETETLPELNFMTVGDIFTWGDQAEDVYNFLSQYPVEIEADEESASISASYESDMEKVTYNFFFDPETEGLYCIQCYTALAEGLDPAAALETLVDTYNLTEVDVYEDENIADIISDYDAGAIVAGDGTIAALAASEETETTYAQIFLMFVDREYWEAA